jgi:hypothetical protein
MFRRRRRAQPATSTEPHETFLGLREMIITISPSEVGLNPSERFPRVWGALLEFGRGEGTASLVTLTDGTTSLYTSAGGGIIGGGEHETVAEASRAYLDAVEARLDRLAPVAELPLPRPGTVRFNVLAHDGRFTAEADQRDLERGLERDLEVGQDALYDLFIAGNDVLTELRLLDEQRS